MWPVVKCWVCLYFMIIMSTTSIVLRYTSRHRAHSFVKTKYPINNYRYQIILYLLKWLIIRHRAEVVLENHKQRHRWTDKMTIVWPELAMGHCFKILYIVIISLI